MSLNIAMIGSGYVGLVSGACLADFGHSVTCVDVDAGRIDALNGGIIPIYEPGLEELVAQTTRAGRLSFATDLTEAVANADVVFIAVGTPTRVEDGQADLSSVFTAARSVAAALRGFTVIAMKSTVPVGTGDEIERMMREARPDADFAVVSNPEFLREGAAINDFREPDRVVLGGADERALQLMGEVYLPLSARQTPVVTTDRRTAELTKYAGNAFLAMKVTFINEIASLCERVGGDVQAVARGIGLDRRIGERFLKPGPGFGGSCFPKDTLALVHTAQSHDSPLRLVETTMAVNEQRKHEMALKIIDACGGEVQGKRIGILGLTFKPGTDDVRDAPSLTIIRDLLDAGATICAYDPQGMPSARQLMPAITYAPNAYEAAAGSDCLVLVTEWDELRDLNLRRIRASMAHPVFVDLRSLYGPDEVVLAGFSYFGIGRGRDFSRLHVKRGDR